MSRDGRRKLLAGDFPPGARGAVPATTAHAPPIQRDIAAVVRQPAAPPPAGLTAPGLAAVVAVAFAGLVLACCLSVGRARRLRASLPPEIPDDEMAKAAPPEAGPPRGECPAGARVSQGEGEVFVALLQIAAPGGVRLAPPWDGLGTRAYRLHWPHEWEDAIYVTAVAELPELPGLPELPELPAPHAAGGGGAAGEGGEARPPRPPGAASDASPGGSAPGLVELALLLPDASVVQVLPAGTPSQVLRIPVRGVGTRPIRFVLRARALRSARRVGEAIYSFTVFGGPAPDPGAGCPGAATGAALAAGAGHGLPGPPSPAPGAGLALAVPAPPAFLYPAAAGAGPHARTSPILASTASLRSRYASRDLARSRAQHSHWDDVLGRGPGPAARSLVDEPIAEGTEGSAAELEEGGDGGDDGGDESGLDGSGTVRERASVLGDGTGGAQQPWLLPPGFYRAPAAPSPGHRGPGPADGGAAGLPAVLGTDAEPGDWALGGLRDARRRQKPLDPPPALPAAPGPPGWGARAAGGSSGAATLHTPAPGGEDATAQWYPRPYPPPPSHSRAGSAAPSEAGSKRSIDIAPLSAHLSRLSSARAASAGRGRPGSAAPGAGSPRAAAAPAPGAPAPGEQGPRPPPAPPGAAAPASEARPPTPVRPRRLFASPCAPPGGLDLAGQRPGAAEGPAVGRLPAAPGASPQTPPRGECSVELGFLTPVAAGEGIAAAAPASRTPLVAPAGGGGTVPNSTGGEPPPAPRARRWQGGAGGMSREERLRRLLSGEGFRFGPH